MSKKFTSMRLASILGLSLVLAAVLGYVLFRPARRAIDADRARHEALEAETAERRTEAEAAYADHPIPDALDW